jgi:hypothetical protein
MSSLSRARSACVCVCLCLSVRLWVSVFVCVFVYLSVSVLSPAFSPPPFSPPPIALHLSLSHLGLPLLSPPLSDPITHRVVVLMAGHLTSFAGSLRAYGVAYACMYGLGARYTYPAFGPAATLSWDWMWPILARNVAGAWLVCGFWDWYGARLARSCSGRRRWPDPASCASGSFPGFSTSPR